MGGFKSYVGFALVLVCCAATMSACGNGSAESDSEEKQVAAAYAKLKDDFEAGHVKRVCGGMTASSRCPAIVRFLRARGEVSTSRVRSGERRVLAVDVRGARATALVTLSKRVPGRLNFVRHDDAWKLTSVDMSADLQRRRWRAVPAVLEDPWPEPKKLSCPPIVDISRGSDRAVRGGCVLHFEGDDVAVVKLTAFGDFVVARCSVGFDLHASSNSSATLADGVEFGGPRLCARIRRCQDGETGLRYPWQGDVPRGTLEEGMHLRVDVCLNTPLGRARGMLHYLLVREDGELVAKPFDYPIGDRSIQLVGEYDVEPDGFR